MKKLVTLFLLACAPVPALAALPLEVSPVLNAAGALSQELDLANAGALTLILPPRNLVTLSRESFDLWSTRDGVSTASWRGTIDGEPNSWAVLTLRQGILVGLLENAEGRWSLSLGNDGIYRIEKVEPLAPGSCGVSDDESPFDLELTFEELGSTPLQSTEPTVMDVVAFYSLKALEAAGSRAKIEAEIANAMDLATLSLKNSDLDFEYHLVAIEPFIGYDETDPERSGLVPFFYRHPEVEFAVQRHQADLAAGFVEGLIGGEFCGLGTLFAGPNGRGASITARHCLPHLTLSHELGHNLGGRHDKEHNNHETPRGVPDGGFGHSWCPDGSSSGFHTVMSYGNPDCLSSRVNRFSNPAVLQGGYPTGLVDEADNARVIRASAPVVASNNSGTCTPSETTLCLGNGVIEISASWRTSSREGIAEAVPFTSAAGYFHFFNPRNPELMVKVLNGCAGGGLDAWWFFAAGLTNVEVTITARQTILDVSKTYTSALGEPFLPILDTGALPCE